MCEGVQLQTHHTLKKMAEKKKKKKKKRWYFYFFPLIVCYLAMDERKTNKNSVFDSTNKKNEIYNSIRRKRRAIETKALS